MGSVYDRPEKEYYHNKRHRCACRDTGILLPNHRQGQLLPDAVFLSAQLYLYRPVRRLGAFCPPADRAKAGMQIYDGHCGASYHLDGSPFGEVFYILAAGRRSLPVVSVLSAHAVCAYAGAADCHVAGETGRIQIPQGNVGSVDHLRRIASARAHKRPAPIRIYLSEGRRRVDGQKQRLLGRLLH